MVAKSKVKDNIVPMPGLNSKPHQKARKKSWLKPGPIMVMMIVAFVLYSFGLQIVQMQKNVHTMNQIESQIAQIEKQNTQLKKEIKRLKTNEYIEKEAREKLGLVKPGEKMILEIVPGKEVTP